MISTEFQPQYSKWRHGGWYVDNVRYPSGACGCVSNNYPDRKWRIVCDERPDPPTFPSRDAAARAEYELIASAKKKEDNARLIAAAPDLLAALEQAIARIELANAEGNPILSAWLPDARAAIAAAKGE